MQLTTSYKFNMGKILKIGISFLVVLNVLILFSFYLPVRHVNMQYFANYDGAVKIYLQERDGTYSEHNIVVAPSTNTMLSFWAWGKELDNIRIDFESDTPNEHKFIIKQMISNSMFYYDVLDVSEVTLNDGTKTLGDGEYSFIGNDPGIIVSKISKRICETNKIIATNLVIFLLSLLGIAKEPLNKKYHIDIILKKIINDNLLVWNYYKNSKILIAVIAVVLMIEYGFKIFNFGMSIDTEIAYAEASMYHRFIEWASQGRFGIGILKSCSPVTYYFVPYVSNLLATAMLGYAALSWNYVLKQILLGNKFIEVIFILLFITCPSYAETMNFSTYNLEVTFGLFLLSLSARHFCLYASSNHRSDFICSIILLVFSISIYQSFVFAFVCISLILIFAESIKVKHRILILTKINCFALVFYFAINAMIKSVLPPNDYIDGFIRWGKAPYYDIYINILNYVKSIFNGSLYFGGELLVLNFFICLICIFLKPRTDSKFWVFLTLFFSLIGHTLLFGGNIPVRSNFVIIWFTSIPICVLLNSLYKAKKNLYHLCILISMVTVVYQICIVSHLMHGEYIKSQNDYYMIQKLGYEIEEQENQFLYLHGKKPQIAIVGSRISHINSNVAIKGEVIGRSFFEWREPNRLLHYMNLMGHDFRAADKDNLEKAKKAIDNIPIWPAKSAVNIYEDLIIVKLSN